MTKKSSNAKSLYYIGSSFTTNPVSDANRNHPGLGVREKISTPTWANRSEEEFAIY